MATPLVVNGTSYSYPATGDQNWGDQTSAWAAAVTSGMLQKAGGVFTLTADVNFGANFGLITKYFTSISANPAGTGVVRLANADSVSWRNAGNSADLSLNVDSSDNLAFNGSAITVGGVPVQTQLSVSDTTTIHQVLSGNTLSSNIIAGSIADSLISASAAIAYSKLALSGAIQNSDLAGSIAYSKLVLTGAVQNSDLAGSIAYSKLTLSNSIVNADISSSAAIAYSKLNLAGSIQNTDLAGSIAYSKLSLSASIVNADISASAAIARSKIASGTANQVLINDGSGNLSSEATLAKSRGGSGQDNSSLTFPASGILVTEAATETLTNKTISGSSNTITNVSLTAGVTGTLPIGNGGTGQTTANAAHNALLPSQTGNSGKFLTTNGTDSSWGTPTGSGLTQHQVYVSNPNGHGSTANKIRRFSTAQINTGTSITYADSATNGATFTINTTGAYSISYYDVFSGSGFNTGVTVNVSSTTTSIDSLTFANGRRIQSNMQSSGIFSVVSGTLWLTAGDVVRAQTDGQPDAVTEKCFFSIIRVV